MRFLAGANSILVGEKLLITANPGPDQDDQLLKISWDEATGTACRLICRSFHGELEGGLRELEAHSQCGSLAEIDGADFCSNDYPERLRYAVPEQAVLRAVRVR